MGMKVENMVSVGTADVYGDATLEELLLVDNLQGQDLLLKVKLDGVDRYVRLTSYAQHEISEVELSADAKTLAYVGAQVLHSKSGAHTIHRKHFLAWEDLKNKIEKQLRNSKTGVQVTLT